MGEMNELTTQRALGKNSQVARLEKIINQTRFSLILGVVLLVLLIVASVSYISIAREELESSMALSQYRLGSKALTAAVQSYAVTGDVQYYDAYMKELNTDKNRETAWEVLQKNDIKADEWAALNEIAGLSNGLVPLEEEAMAAVAVGNNRAAIEFVFGSEYVETIQRISSLTDDTIDQILDRLKAKKTIFLILEITCVIVFVAAFMRLVFDSIKTFRFSQKELLVPIIKVSDQMTAIAHGNLNAELDLEEDDSEVGNMVESIGFMKNNIAGMIEELKNAADSAIRAEQAKAHFLSNMSHEIRTPINAILGMNEMILRECTDSHLLDYAGNIQSSGRTLLTLINDILDMSKIESGKMEILPTEYKTADLFMDLWNVIYLRARGKNLSISFTLDEKMPGILYGDDVRVKQILTNILTNAVKYTFMGGVKLHASYEKQGEDMIALIVSVEDTGIGIREEDQDRLFDNFQRLDENRNRNIEGTGLGMSITLMLLKLMDGDIKVESVYQEGSTFTVRIPQKVINDEPVGGFEPIRNSRTMTGAKTYDSFEAPEANILVVDDNTMNLVVFTSLLKLTKMNIVTAESGKKCLELVKEQPFHIIFMDHMMPKMDGVEALHEIRKMKGFPNEKTPVVALTANAISGAREYYLEEGFADFLTKPIESDKLEQMVVEYLPENLVHEKETKAEESLPENWVHKKETKAEGSLPENWVHKKETKAEESGKENDAVGMSGREQETALVTDAYETPKALVRLIVEYLPEDLVRKMGFKVEECRKENNVPVESGTAFQSRYQEYGISIDKGISNAAGNMKLYLKLMEMFIQDKKTQAQLKQFIADDNAHDYGIQVHALKGNARTLGADSLADVAYEHEKQSKAGNLAYVEEHWDELVDCWERTLTGFKEYYREKGGEQTDAPVTASTVTDADSRTIEITSKEITEVVSLIDAYKTPKAVERMKEWLQNSLKPEQRMLIESALAAIEEEYDEDKAIEILTDH